MSKLDLHCYCGGHCRLFFSFFFRQRLFVAQFVVDSEIIWWRLHTIWSHYKNSCAIMSFFNFSIIININPSCFSLWVDFHLNYFQTLKNLSLTLYFYCLLYFTHFTHSTVTMLWLHPLHRHSGNVVNGLLNSLGKFRCSDDFKVFRMLYMLWYQ